MNKALRSITILLPLCLAIGIVFISAVGMLNGYQHRLAEINRQSAADIKSLIAQLSHLAEQAFRTDPQLLFDDITQRATDPRVEAAVTIDADGKIIYATDFSWSQKSVKSVLPLINDMLLEQAMLVEGAEIEKPVEFAKRLNRVMGMAL